MKYCAAERLGYRVLAIYIMLLGLLSVPDVLITMSVGAGQPGLSKTALLFVAWSKPLIAILFSVILYIYSIYSDKHAQEEVQVSANDRIMVAVLQVLGIYLFYKSLRVLTDNVFHPAVLASKFDYGNLYTGIHIFLIIFALMLAIFPKRVNAILYHVR